MEQEVKLDILSSVNREKFRRRMVFLSRGLAVLLIISIFWVGYVQVVYVKEVNEIKGKYGSLGYCYMCGKETFRKCECQYYPTIHNQIQKLDLEVISNETALYNVQDCPIKDLNPIINTSSLAGLLNSTN